MAEQFQRYKNEFVADQTVLVWGAIVAVLLFIGGIACFVISAILAAKANWELEAFHNKNFSWSGFGLLILIGLGLCGFACYLLYHSYQNIPYRIRVGREHLIVRTRQGEDTIPWHEIELFRETHEYVKRRIKYMPNVVANEILGPDVVAKTYRICLKNGRYYDIDDLKLKGGTLLGGLLKARAAEQAISWEFLEIH